MRKHARLLRFEAIAVCSLFLVSNVPALAQGVPDVCPKGYSVFETVCLDEVTGDIVNQKPIADKACSSDKASDGKPCSK